MKNIELKPVAQAIEEMLYNEKEYGNPEIDENSPAFLQFAKENGNREEVVDYIISVLEKGGTELDEVYVYLLINEGDVRDQRCVEDTPELAEIASKIDETIRQVEEIGKQNIERDKLSHDDR